MRAVLVTRGRAVPTKGSHVRIEDHDYLVVEAQLPDDLDDTTSVTECEIQPSVAPRGTPALPARLHAVKAR